MIAACIRNDVPADHDGVAGKTLGVRAFGFDQVGYKRANCLLAVVIESGWVPDRLVVGERTEAGVEVVIARVDQFDWDNANAEQPPDLLMSGGVAAHTVSGIECVTTEKSVAGAFEAEVFGNVDDFK